MDSAPNPLARGRDRLFAVRRRLERRGGALRRGRESRRRGAQSSEADGSVRALLADLALREQMEDSAALAARLRAPSRRAGRASPAPAPVRRLPRPAPGRNAGGAVRGRLHQQCRRRGAAARPSEGRAPLVLALAQAIEADVAARAAALIERLSPRRSKPLDGRADAWTVPFRTCRIPDLVALQPARSRRGSTPGSSASWVRRLAWAGGRRRSCLFARGLAVISPPACRAPRSCSPTSRRCRPTSAAMTAIRSRPSPASGGSSSPMTNIRRWSSTPSSRPRTRPSSAMAGSTIPGLVGAVFDYTTQVGQRRPRQGRLDHHPAGRQISAAGRRVFGQPQDPRGDPRLPARGSTLTQAADPRALPQLRSSSAATPMACRRRAAPISTRTSPT